eukprot:ANDGO_02764.mRNA.1 Small RNA degrading nuclease 5
MKRRKTGDEDSCSDTSCDEPASKVAKSCNAAAHAQQDVQSATLLREQALNESIYGKDAKIKVKLLKNLKSFPFKFRSNHFHELIQWLLLPDAMNPKWVLVVNKPLLSRVAWLIVNNQSETAYDPKKTVDSLKANACAVLGSVDVYETFWVQEPRDKVQEKADAKERERKGEETVAALEKENQCSSQKKAQSNFEIAVGTCSVSSVVNRLTVEAMTGPVLVEDIEPYARLFDVKAGPYTSDIECVSCSNSSSFCIHRTAVASRAEDSSGVHNVLAIDCEMVITSRGRELARLSVVGADRKVLLDAYIKTEYPVVDYLTKHSGITPELLKTATLTRDGALEKLTALMHSKTVLIGHSLQNDLAALGIAGCSHVRVSDTAVLYPHRESDKYCHSLKFLARQYLTRDIQVGHEGHDSVEDALAAMDLVKIKVRHGPLFGLPDKNHRPRVNLFSLMSRHSIQSSLFTSSTNDTVLSRIAPAHANVSLHSCDSGEDLHRRFTTGAASTNANSKFVVGLYSPSDFESMEHFSQTVERLRRSLPLNSVLLVSVFNSPYAKDRTQIQNQNQSQNLKVNPEGLFSYIVKRTEECDDD